MVGYNNLDFDFNSVAIIFKSFERTSFNMMRIVLFIFLLLHGIAHLVGFMVPWKMASPEGLSYKTTILWGKVDLGNTGIRIIGVVWLLLFLAFLAAAAGIWIPFQYWKTFTAFVCALSLVMSVLGLPDSRIGIPVNAIILVTLFMFF